MLTVLLAVKIQKKKKKRGDTLNQTIEYETLILEIWGIWNTLSLPWFQVHSDPTFCRIEPMSKIDLFKNDLRSTSVR